MGTETMYITKKIAGIPCLVIHDRNACEEAPVCFMYHGWGSSKDVLRFFGSILADHGFTVYIPEVPYHGERGKLDYHTPSGLQHFWDVVMETVDEFPSLLQGMYEEENRKPRQLFLFGSSMGGFAASAIFARHRELSGLVNLMGACAWEKAEEVFRKMEGKEPGTDEELSKIREYDPIGLLKQAPLRPIMMLHGNADSVVPVEIQRFAYEMLQSAAGAYGLLHFMKEQDQKPASSSKRLGIYSALNN